METVYILYLAHRNGEATAWPHALIASYGTRAAAEDARDLLLRRPEVSDLLQVTGWTYGIQPLRHEAERLC